MYLKHKAPSKKLRYLALVFALVGATSVQANSLNGLAEDNPDLNVFSGECRFIYPNGNTVLAGSFNVSKSRHVDGVSLEGYVGPQADVLVMFFSTFVFLRYSVDNNDPETQIRIPNKISENPSGFVVPIKDDFDGRQLSCLGLFAHL